MKSETTGGRVDARDATIAPSAGGHRPARMNTRLESVHTEQGGSADRSSVRQGAVGEPCGRRYANHLATVAVFSMCVAIQ